MSRIIKHLKEYLTDKRKRFYYNFALGQYLGLYRKTSDEKFLKKAFKASFARKLNLNNPQTFNEKLQWLKLYNRNPLYTTLVDKYLVRDYIKANLGEEYLIPLLGVWDKAEDIDFDTLPNEFVLKCNHNSGLGMYICKDKNKLSETDIANIRKDLNKGIQENYYLRYREWPYKNVPRKIIAEKYMTDESGYELKDYKFFCFNGEVKALYVACDRNKQNEETKFDFFDTEFNHLPFKNAHPNSTKAIKKPKSFEKMLEIATNLSKGFPHVRIDLYDINGKIYFGEFTFFHMSGLSPFEPEKWDYTFGQWLALPPKNK